MPFNLKFFEPKAVFDKIEEKVAQLRPEAPFKPYLSFQLGNESKQTTLNAPFRDTHPVWTDTITFRNLSSMDPAHQTLKVTCFYKTGKETYFLGSSESPVESLRRSRTREVTLPLLNKYGLEVGDLYLMWDVIENGDRTAASPVRNRRFGESGVDDFDFRNQGRVSYGSQVSQVSHGYRAPSNYSSSYVGPGYGGRPQFGQPFEERPTYPYQSLAGTRGRPKRRGRLYGQPGGDFGLKRSQNCWFC